MVTDLASCKGLWAVTTSTIQHQKTYKLFIILALKGEVLNCKIIIKINYHYFVKNY
jgi:hypothetical protein